jgi:two-component system cell cycle sensor histidine kinase PleC
MHDADRVPESLLAELAALRQQHAALAAVLADQQRAERESDARFRDLIEGSIQGIVIHRNFTPLFANQASATILGYESPDEIIMLGSLLPLFPPAERVRLTGYVQARQEGRSVSRQQEHQVWRKDGTPIWLDAKIREIIWEGEPALQVTIFDITERKRSEETLRQQAEARALANAELQRSIVERQQAAEALRLAKEAAEEASRAKSTFLATMSHELRTPLGSIIGFANLLAKNKGGHLQPQERLYVERIRANSLHLLGLINDILDLSKIEAGRVELECTPIWLAALVQEVVAQFAGTIRGAQVQLLTAMPPCLAPLYTDVSKLRQVLLNLVGNALKFTPRGQVTVRVESDPATQQPRRIDVIDTGIGIPAARLEGIFERFQQADNSTARKYGGTGPGLAISRALCQLLGYQLTVESTVGQGSTFCIIMPVSPSPYGVADPAPPVLEPANAPACSAPDRQARGPGAFVKSAPDAGQQGCPGAADHGHRPPALAG